MSEQLSRGTAPAALTVERLWTVRDVMAFLQLGRNTVYDLATRGVLPSFRIGSLVRFDPAKIRAWLEQQAAPGATVLPLPRRP